jgi:hypothetical protein
MLYGTSAGTCVTLSDLSRRDMQLDVLGLLETDLSRIVFGNRDLYVCVHLCVPQLILLPELES